jgi:phage/plasmid primase-like uncharacterized protein/RecA-family ATPase
MNNNCSQQSNEHAFQEEIRRHGIEPPREIIADSKLHRFAPTKSKRDQDGWYVFHGLAGAFGDWSQGIKEKWSIVKESFTIHEREQLNRQIDESKKATDEETKRKNEETAKEATKIWEEALEEGDSEYLKAKKVSAYGIRYSQDKYGRFIAVPKRDIDGRLWNLEKIYNQKSDGSNNKWPLKGGRKKGCFYTIGKALDEIKEEDWALVCEGYATGASIYAATGSTVIVAFDAGNIDSVIGAIRERYPKIRFVVTADNDQWNEEGKNTGLDAAHQSQKKYGCAVVSPTFKPEHHAHKPNDKKPTDFNDLHCLEGLDEVKKQIANTAADFHSLLEFNFLEVSTKSSIEEDFSDCDIRRYEGTPTPPEFLLEGLFPMASVSILAAAGGVGKGMLMLNLALNLACTTSSSYGSAFGPRVVQNGSVVLFSAEDNQEELHRRYAVLDPTNTRNHINTGINTNQIYSIPLPNTGGAFPIIEQDKIKGFQKSQKFKDVSAWLKTITNLKLIIFDPIASFIWGADTNDAGAMTFLMNTLQGLATETGACCLVTHHTNKPGRNSQGRIQAYETLEDIFHSMRGSTAIANGARLVYVISEAPQDIQDKICKALGQKQGRHTIYIGGVGKANGIANKEEQYFVRNEETGLLRNVTAEVNKKTVKKEDQEELLLKAIEDQEYKNPYTLTGPGGLFQRKHELSPPLNDLSKRKLEELATDLLKNNKVGQYAKIGSTKASYLGTTDGLLSQGKIADKKAAIWYDPLLKKAFIQAIFEAEKNGQPFRKNGSSAPWKKKEKLPSEFHNFSKKQLEGITEDVLKEKSIVTAMHGSEKNAQWLCSPNGQLAKDPESYEFTKGAA